ncbi:pyridoxal phosphate-dependent aminotransferase [Candidatus Woesearchaeota archaeon]|nr:pyridoxal phosphate-dependent aminotransferase [Candidatus Woesearchaeota archaeon]
MGHISERESELPDTVVNKLLCIVAENKDVISLSLGEPDFTTPKPLLDYAKKVIDKSTHYSPTAGYSELKEAIAKKLRKENKIKCEPDNIIAGTGSQELFMAGFSSALDVTEEVVLPSPCYLAYIPQIELVNGIPKLFQLKEEDNWNINSDELKKIIDKKKTKVILINTPSNPTGNVLDRKLLEEVADIAVENDLYIFADEAYEKLIYDKKHVSIGSFNGMEDYVVTFQTFSKSYAMCGFRLGYACGPKKLIEAMTKVSHYITLAPPSLSQLIGIKALSLPQIYIEKMRKEYDRRRKYIVKRLNEIGLKTATPNGAFYAFSNIKPFAQNSYKFANSLLTKQKVAVVPGTEFGKYGEGYIRFSYATDLKLIEKGLDKIEKFLKR